MNPRPDFAEIANEAAAQPVTRTWFIVSQVKSHRVVYFTDDPGYTPPTEGDWYYISPYQGELPKATCTSQSPPQARKSRSPNLSYAAGDGAASTPATQSFVLAAVNDAPALTGVKASLSAGSEDTAYTITQASLLAGFSDADGNALSIVNLSAGNGSLSAFNAAINANQLWFRKAGNDLEASIIGTADSFTVQDWYSGSQYHVEQIRSGDGKVLQDSRVDLLVQAMAGIAPPAMGQTSLTAAQQTALAPVLAANWH